MNTIGLPNEYSGSHLKQNLINLLQTVIKHLSGNQKCFETYEKQISPLSAVPVVWVGQLSWFGQIVEAVYARTGLSHGLAVEATAIKVGQLLSVVLLILIWVIVVGAHHIVQRFTVGFLRFGGPAERAKRNETVSCKDLTHSDLMQLKIVSSFETCSTV